MPAAAIRKKIEEEIGDNWRISNLHGIDLRRSLLGEPLLTSYKNSFFDPEKPEDDHNQSELLLWLVLQEDPAAKDGYEIVYNEALGLFGLATSGILIGNYRSFIDALEAM